MKRRLVNAAVVDMLATVTGETVALVELATLVPEQTNRYVLVEPLEGAQIQVGWDGRWDDASLPYQITSSGANVQQADFVADAVRDAIRSGALTLDGYSVNWRLPDGGPDKPVRQGENWYSVSERFTLQVGVS